MCAGRFEGERGGSRYCVKFGTNSFCIEFWSGSFCVESGTKSYYKFSQQVF